MYVQEGLKRTLSAYTKHHVEGAGGIAYLPNYSFSAAGFLVHSKQVIPTASPYIIQPIYMDLKLVAREAWVATCDSISFFLFTPILFNFSIAYPCYCSQLLLQHCWQHSWPPPTPLSWIPPWPQS